MNTNNYLLISFAFVLLMACSENQSTEVTAGDNILQRDSINDLRIPLDQSTKLNLRAVRHQRIDSKPYLYFLNDNNNSIYRYDLTEPSNFEKLRFDKEGPLGVGELTGFDVSGQDTLLLLARYDYKLTLVSEPWEETQQLQTFRLRGKSLDMTPYATTQSRIVAKRDKLYTLSVPFFKLGTSSFFEKGNNLLILNMKDSTVRLENMYTDIYKKNWSGHYDRAGITYNERKGMFIATLPADSRLLTFTEPENVSLVDVVNSTIAEAQVFKGNHDSNDEMNDHLYRNPRYREILFDEFRNVYYRTIEMPNERAVRNNEKDKMSIRALKIQVFDKDFVLIGEQQLPPYYFHGMIFVNEKGLYLATVETGPEGIEEDVVRYNCFKLSN